MNLHTTHTSPQASLRLPAARQEGVTATKFRHCLPVQTGHPAKVGRSNPKMRNRAKSSLSICLFVWMILIGQVGWAQWSGSGTTTGSINRQGKVILNSSGWDEHLEISRNGMGAVFKPDNSTGYLGLRMDLMGVGSSFYVMNGNMGIGTTNPLFRLDVEGGGFRIKNSDATNGTYTTFRLQGPDYTNGLEIDFFGNNNITSDPNWSYGGGAGSASIVNVNAKPLTFGTSNIGRMLIDAAGNVGMGTATPSTNLHIANANGGGIRLGGVGEPGTFNVPIGSQAASFNIDFTGYRDVTPDQIGARIAALRFNNYGAGAAYVQTTGLAFYTNPSGWTPGTTDLYERMRIAPDGNVGIGTTTPDAKLAVKGSIHTQEVKVDMIGWSDYVFDADYNLPSLEEVKKYIDQHHHLPEIPSAKEVVENGIMLGEMNKLLVKKMEEMTLYMIEMKEENESLKARLDRIESQIDNQ